MLQWQHCSVLLCCATLLCYIVVLHCCATLFCYIDVLHCCAILLCFMLCYIVLCYFVFRNLKDQGVSAWPLWLYSSQMRRILRHFKISYLIVHFGLLILKRCRFVPFVPVWTNDTVLVKSQ